ncbi:PAS domain S-box protein [Phenylobacterium sp. LjRoot225]|uniref:PAS domain-containing sensor histidine kinase n=1 Tax=Phenylobacterium sp. LjRoot225 TaxID=3342285 RepID=UPI003ECCDAF9
MAKLETHVDETTFLRGGGAMGALIAQYDWASTSLGPMKSWPPSLKTAAGLVLRSPIPMLLRWGEEGVLIYNDAYAVIAGARHPQLLGTRVREGWKEFADFEDRIMKPVLGGATLEYRNQGVTLRRSGKPERLWFDLDYSPVPDESGRPAGVLGIVVDTTQRVLAERKAAAHAQRQQLMFQQAPGFICLLSGPDHVFQFRNEAHKLLFGERDAIGRPHDQVFADLPDENLRNLLDHTFATGKRYIGRAQPIRVRRSPGGLAEELFLDFVLEPVIGDDGAVTGIFVEGFDVTQQVRAQAAAIESEQRLSAAKAIARLGVFVWDRVSREATLDARAREIFGFAPDESVTVDDVQRRIDPRDLDSAQASAANFEAAGQKRRKLEYRIRLPDGSNRTVVSISDLLPGPHGPNTRAVGVFDDVTERRAAEKRQRMLLNELNHRVKNTLATVQSIAAQTLRSAPDLVSARDSFESRLVALAAAHDLLTAESWHGARLSDVVATTMAPFETVQRPQISRSGPPVWLSAPRALALSLALHELATNAAKYGALSVPEGSASIRWTVSGEELTLSWRETGGPPVTAPCRSGFGTRLLQRSLAQELHGQVEVCFAPEGVRCEIRCPAEQVDAADACEILEVGCE